MISISYTLCALSLYTAFPKNIVGASPALGVAFAHPIRTVFAKKIKCEVLEKKALSPEVLRIRFSSNKKFSYRAGQFLSVVVPIPGGRHVKRCYTLATSPEEAASTGIYELCIKVAPSGAGSNYLNELSVGDSFTAFAPFGSFVYKAPPEKRDILFLCTSTGIAPFRSMIASTEFQEGLRGRVTVVVGIRDESERLYERDLLQLGVEVIYVVSKPTPTWTGNKGRITDYLKSLPKDSGWHQTDFYLCGNGEMIQDVGLLLRGAFGVSTHSIHQENFSQPNPSQNGDGEKLAHVPASVSVRAVA